MHCTEKRKKKYFVIKLAAESNSSKCMKAKAINIWKLINRLKIIYLHNKSFDVIKFSGTYPYIGEQKLQSLVE